jgi:hypothetical protein
LKWRRLWRPTKLFALGEMMASKGYDADYTFFSFGDWHFATTLRTSNLGQRMRESSDRASEHDDRIASAVEAQAQALNDKFKPIRKVSVPDEVKP